MSPGDETLINAISNHFETFLGTPDFVMHEVVSPLIHVDVHLIWPSATRPFLTVFTTGMAELPMAVPEKLDHRRYAELMMRLPMSWPTDPAAFKEEKWWWPLGILKLLARYPHEQHTWLGPSHTVAIHEPGTPPDPHHPFSAVLIRSPPDLSTDFRLCRVDESRVVNLYSVMPLFAEELEVKVTKGPEALSALFERRGVSDVVDPSRRNAAKKRLWRW